MKQARAMLWLVSLYARHTGQPLSMGTCAARKQGYAFRGTEQFTAIIPQKDHDSS